MNSFSAYRKTLTLLITVLLFFSNIPMCESVQKREGDAKRILVLYSFHEGLPWEMALDRSLRETLESKSDSPIELYTEHTDLVNYSDGAYIRKLVELYHHKYSKSGMDLIIGVGDEAAGILRD